MRTTVLDKICEDLLEKYKENKLNITFEAEYKTPAFNKFNSQRFGSSTTFESENQINKMRDCNSEEVGNELKMQWNQMMKEFEMSSSKKQIPDPRFLGSYN